MSETTICAHKQSFIKRTYTGFVTTLNVSGDILEWTHCLLVDEIIPYLAGVISYLLPLTSHPSPLIILHESYFVDFTDLSVGFGNEFDADLLFAFKKVGRNLVCLVFEFRK